MVARRRDAFGFFAVLAIDGRLFRLCDDVGRNFHLLGRKAIIEVIGYILVILFFVPQIDGIEFYILR